MAKRRMFSIPLMEADRFYELSALSQALYFHLNLNADDDGLVDNVRSVMRDLKASKNNMRQLIEEGYVIELTTKVVAIAHWNQHNRIKSDRYTKTAYGELLSQLRRDDNDRYFKASEAICGDICAPQESVVKDSTVEYSIAKDSAEEHRAEEKRENIYISHSYKQSSVASLPNTDIRNDSILYNNFINAIRLYFMKKYNSIDSKKFIEHYDGLNWYSGTDKITPENFKDYVDQWMKG